MSNVFSAKEVLEAAPHKDQVVFPDCESLESWRHLLEKYPKLKFNCTYNQNGVLSFDEVFWNTGKIPLRAQLELTLFCRHADELEVSNTNFAAWWD